MSDSNRGPSLAAALGLVLLLLLCGFGYFAWQSHLISMAQLKAMQAAELMAMQEQQAALQAASVSAAPAAAQSQPLPPLHLTRTTLDTPANVQAATTTDTTTADESPQAIIKGLLAQQQSAWNSGDLEAFMKVYWHSDQLTFCSGGKTTRGWQATLDNYKAKYSTKEKLGKLTFDQLEFTPLSDSIMLVLGRWHLERGPDSIGGNYSLVWQKLDGQWLIIHDHSSAQN